MKRRILSAVLFVATPIMMATASTSDLDKEAAQIIATMTLEEKVSQMVNSTVGIERLDILPYDWWNEALHGVARNGRATIFPQSLGLAATFDSDLIKEVATAISDEARAKYNLAQAAGNYSRYTGLSFWSPNINILRDPRWGRGHETFGEDPFLTGTIGVAFVEGMQGDDPRYLKTAACAKHYAVHSGPEGLRHEFDAYPTKQDLFETYLPAFEMLVRDAKVESVMGAYNRVYGESASANHYLLTEILRNRWGFNGHVVSDCGAVADIYKGHGIAKDAAEASAIALKSGLNLNCGSSYLSLVEAVERGLVSEKEIDTALTRLIVTKLKLGLLGDNTNNPYTNIDPSVICSTEHKELSREAAAKSMVLLSNKNNTLPLKKDIKRIGVTGAYAADNFVLMGNYYGVSDTMTSFLEGIVSKVDVASRVGYSPGIMANVANTNPLSWLSKEVVDTEACIVSIGLSGFDEGEEGEALASSAIGDRLTFDLPKYHLDYLRRVKNRASGDLIVVVSGCSAMDLSEVVELADAVILTWYPGGEGGAALADILFGDVSPSGRMPVTFPTSVEQLPPFEDYSMRGRTYRYMTEKPQYTFGYGLSYTTFDYSKLALSVANNKKFDTLDISLTVSNTGDYCGDEVVQAYITTPNSSKSNPICSLVRFTRTTIKKGESKEVTMQINKDQLKEITESGESQLTPGLYTLRVGNSSPSERSEELGGKWVESEFTIDSKGRITL